MSTDTVRHAIGPTILLFSGHYFDFGDPEGSFFDIGDIARGLSHICRFAGQVPGFYSVAEHSVYVSQIVPLEHALAGLLHDAAEAFVGDMAKPLKVMCPDYQAIEKRVESAVLARFGVSLPLDPSIKEADVRMLRTERAQLMHNRDDWDCTRGHSAVDGLKIAALAPDDAFNLFVERFEELTGWTGIRRAPAPVIPVDAVGLRSIDTMAMWAVGVVTDGERAAIAQKAESDHVDHYFAVEPEDGLDWEPTHWAPMPAGSD